YVCKSLLPEVSSALSSSATMNSTEKHQPSRQPYGLLCGFTSRFTACPSEALVPVQASEFDVRCSMFAFAATLNYQPPDGLPHILTGGLTGVSQQPAVKNLNVFAILPAATSTTTNDCKGLTGPSSRIPNLFKGVDGLTGKIPQD